MGKRILVLSVNAWDDNSGNNTLQNIFSSFDPTDISALYLRSDLPNTKSCSRFFQISEVACMRKLLRMIDQCGKEVDNKCVEGKSDLLDQERNITRYYKKINQSFVLCLRELMWAFGAWKEAALDDYVDDINPDYVFVFVSSFVFSNKIAHYIVQRIKKPVILYFVDDNLTYNAISKNPFALIQRYYIRKTIKSLLPFTKNVCVISPMMKREYDKLLKIDSLLLTKGIENVNKDIFYTSYSNKSSIKLMYAGKLIYGRDKILLQLSQYLSTIKSFEIELHIYTQTELNSQTISAFESTSVCKIHKPIPYNELCKIQKEFDYLLFVESFVETNIRLVRLSFSTKITEYLASGKKIIAIGPEKIAPIQYLKEKECALVVTSVKDFFLINKLFESVELQNSIIENAYDCIKQSHSQEYVNRIMHKILS